MKKKKEEKNKKMKEERRRKKIKKNLFAGASGFLIKGYTAGQRARSPSASRRVHGRAEVPQTSHGKGPTSSPCCYFFRVNDPRSASGNDA